jgi:hypothetical protein
MIIDNAAEKDIYTVYVIGSITYLPHYTQPLHYVGPGYGHWNYTVYYATTLLAAGAIPKQEHLLKRAGQDRVNKKVRAYERAKR